MKPSEPPGELPAAGGDRREARARTGPVIGPRRYGRYVGLLAFAILVLITINIALTKPHGVNGVATGHRIPPFAAPLASGDLDGAVNVATSANDGAAGKRPACEVRGAGVLNICELYERGPVVLALFVDAGSCPGVLRRHASACARIPRRRLCRGGDQRRTRGPAQADPRARPRTTSKSVWTPKAY